MVDPKPVKSIKGIELTMVATYPSPYQNEKEEADLLRAGGDLSSKTKGSINQSGSATRHSSRSLGQRRRETKS